MIKKAICIFLAAAALSGCSARTAPEREQAPGRSVDESAAQSSQAGAGAVDSLPESGGSQEAAQGADSSVPEPALSEPASSSPLEGSEVDAQWNLILVNYQNPIPEDFAPELAEVQNGYKMDARVADIVKQMIADAKEQGVELTVCSAYRPYSSQKRNFDSSVDSYVAAGYSRDQAVTETMRLIAQPGKSEHQTGLAADIVAPSYQRLDEGFADTEAGKWLAENAPDYGFILRYPKDKTEITRIDYEPWHFRYVGIEAAKEIASKGLCLEEYLE